MTSKLAWLRRQRAAAREKSRCAPRAKRPRRYLHVRRLPSDVGRSRSPTFSTRPSFTSNRSAKSASTEQLERAERGLEAVVAHRDVLAHAPADVAVAEDHEARVGQAGPRLVAQHERGAERIDGGRRERLGPLAVDAQAELGEEPRVAEEQAVREARRSMSPDGERDRERRALDQRHDAAVTAERRARRHRPRLRHARHATAASVPSDASYRSARRR